MVFSLQIVLKKPQLIVNDCDECGDQTVGNVEIMTSLLPLSLQLELIRAFPAEQDNGNFTSFLFDTNQNGVLIFSDFFNSLQLESKWRIIRPIRFYSMKI